MGGLSQGLVYLEKIPDVMRSSKLWLTSGFGAAFMGVPLVGRTTGPLEDLQGYRIMAETIFNESEATPYVTAWRNSNSRPMTQVRLAPQEIFDPVEKGLAPHPPQQSSPFLFGAGGTLQVPGTQPH